VSNVLPLEKKKKTHLALELLEQQLHLGRVRLGARARDDGADVGGLGVLARCLWFEFV